jgi:co-chaperonin GroES (HSP10)
MKPSPSSILKSSKIIMPKGPRLKLKPMSNWLLVEAIEPDEIGEKTLGGVVIPEGSRVEEEWIKSTKVIDRGPDVRGIEIGDTILVSKGQTQKHVFEGNSYWQVQETGVIGIVQP